MQCPECASEMTKKWGRDRNGYPRVRCPECGHACTERPPSPIAPMRIPFDGAVLALNLLAEGMSIRSAQRVTSYHRDTIGRLLLLAGGKCEVLLDRLVVNVPVEDVEADELWAFIGMKEKTKDRKGLDATSSATATPTSGWSGPRSSSWRTTPAGGPGTTPRSSSRSSRERRPAASSSRRTVSTATPTRSGSTWGTGSTTRSSSSITGKMPRDSGGTLRRG